MPGMNGTGPEGKGSGTGRRLGRCNKALVNDSEQMYGVGMGLRRQNGGGMGKKRRSLAGRGAGRGAGSI